MTDRGNAKTGKPNATDEKVLAAARLANADEFAEILQDKRDADIGEKTAYFGAENLIIKKTNSVEITEFVFLVETIGLEPTTYTLRTYRSTG